MSASSCGMSSACAGRMSISSGRERRGELHTVAAGALCGVLRMIRVSEQMLSPDPERIARGDADAAGEIDGRTVALDAYLRHSPADAFRDGVGGRSVGAVENHHELFPTVAPDDIRLAQLRLYGPDDPRQARIASRVTAAVVDVLEMVEIEEQHGDRQPTSLGAHARRVEPLDERAAVEYAGERIGLRTPFGIGERERLCAQAVGGAECDQ